MDPLYIETGTWQTIFTLINYGFWWAGMMIVAALLLLFAQALVPSLVLTSHLPAAAHSLRPLIYLLSAIIFALGILNGVRFVSTALTVAGSLYPKFLI